MKMIASFEDHEHIEGQFLLGNVSKGVNASGGAYLSVELRDASGSIVGKKWDATPEDEQLFVVGNVIQVVGETNKYKEQLQLKILSAELVSLEQIDVEKFVKAPPVAKETLIERFNAHVNSIKNEDCLKLLKYMINKFGDKIYSYPAAVSIHHEYSSGLLMHSITMADLASHLRIPSCTSGQIFQGFGYWTCSTRRSCRCRRLRCSGLLLQCCLWLT